MVYLAKDFFSTNLTTIVIHNDSIQEHCVRVHAYSMMVYMLLWYSCDSPAAQSFFGQALAGRQEELSMAGSRRSFVRPFVFYDRTVKNVDSLTLCVYYYKI